MFGYTFTGWDKTASDIKETTDNVVVTAQFIKNAVTYKFYVSSDITLTAVYVDENEIVEQKQVLL